tara:strand:+ start:693 stop:812 length:120 start_codon:yes stop_codon:yes gene_type:complete
MVMKLRFKKPTVSEQELDLKKQQEQIKKQYELIKKLTGD